jgi:hypothetical protein
MSVIGSNILAGASGQGGDYTIARSLRFRSSASAYLNRTPASAGNQQTWTYSTWVKRGAISTESIILSSAGPNHAGGADIAYIAFNGSDTLQYYMYPNGGPAAINLQTTQVFRDPSAWYHIVIQSDTTNATSSDRIKIYVNGTRVTSFGTATYPSQNYSSSYINSAREQIISQEATRNRYPFDGYLTEVNFIDGQALTPSSFGANSPTTGVWQPKKYAGTYGTNGFYLPFSDNASTTTLGNDFSGNGNNWTTNNISVTAGATYDSMTDVPTLTSATAANFCTLNPLIPITTTTFTNGNLGLNAYNPTSSVFGTIGVSSGKWYFESVAQRDAISGISGTLNGGAFPGAPANGYAWDSANAEKYNNGVGAAYGSATSNGDIIGVAFDLDAGTITFYKNNVSQGVAYTFSPSGSYFPAFRNGDPAGVPPGSNISVNFGQQPFAYTPPTGFVALNTFNLPTPTIGATASTQANKYMDATLYTGTGGTLSVTNSGGFQPDLVWIKSRSLAYAHNLCDSVRGVNNTLSSNSTGAENYAGAGDITAFNTNGFSIRQTSNWELSSSGATYVGWQWAGNGTGVSNTAGSITSTVSANTSAGFSVVTWTGAGSVGTIGHGLGVAPNFIIIKRRNAAVNWFVGGSNIASAGNGTWSSAIEGLNTTAAVNTGATAVFNSTAPTSTVFTGGSELTTNTGTFVAYCFSEVAGYSKFGSYTGNGSSTDGPFVFTGFRPKFVMIKKTATGGGARGWIMLDSSRSPYNVIDNFLYANSSDAEFTNQPIDFLSNGFKIRTDGLVTNDNGITNIYMAFAENPFKYSLAR